jgi:hypothetical protein
MACAAIGCRVERHLQAHVAKGSRVARPAFVLAGHRRPDAIQVRGAGRVRGGAGGQGFWELAVVRRGVAAAVDTLRYGEAPAGYAATTPARALFPGLYQIDVTVAGQTGRAFFQVQTDGTVNDASGVR